MTKTVTYEEALAASTTYFKGDNLAAKVFVDKYALKNGDKYYEDTPDKMHKRLAGEFARIEAKYPNGKSKKEIYEALKDFRYIVPQGSPMSAIGNPYKMQSLSNCFVVSSAWDSYGGICYVDQEQAQLMKRRGGVGHDISNIRPQGTETNNAAGTTDGIGIFMDRFSNTCREVGQCVAEGERVLTKRGLVAIENVIPNEDLVWTDAGWINVNNVLHNGPKKVWKVTTEEGFEIRTSEDHIFLTEESGELVERRLKDFEAGDTIVTIPGTTNRQVEYIRLPTFEYDRGRFANNSSRLNNVKFPEELNENLAYLLGYMYGDGSVEYDRFGEPKRIDCACAHDWPEIQDRLANIIYDLFAYQAKVGKGDGALNKLIIHSKLIAGWMQHNSLLKKKAHEIEIPSHVIKSPPSVQMAFLAGFFDADGYASGKKKGYVWSTISMLFAKEIQKLLMSNGIISKIHTEERSSKGWQNLNSVSVTAKYAQERLVELTFGFSVKVGQSKFVAKRDNYLTPYIAKTFGIKPRNFPYIPDNSQNISAQAFLRVRNEIYEDTGEDLGEPLVMSKVAEIVPDKIEETYDLSLDSEHLFWCEGYYIHNSGRRGALMLTIDCHHPEIRTFISIKKDLMRVTGANISIKWSDEFLKAVEKKKKVQLRWPVNEKDNPEISLMEDAKTIWDEFINAAWSSAEPGCLFWDTATERTPSDIYADQGFESLSTNPCLTYDTKVAVADGRGSVPIGDLAKEGKDVPVYALNKDGRICVKTMRHPRLTGKNKDVYKVTVEGGHSFKATPNHKVMVNGQGYVRVDELQAGDSLELTVRKEASIKDVFPNANSDSQDYIWWKSPYRKVLKSDHRLIWEASNGKVPKGSVIHHIDFNAQNNSLDNLRCMTTEAHNKLHAECMMGDKNPYHKMSEEWKFNFASHPGDANPKYSGVTHEDIKRHAISLTQTLNRRFSNEDWLAYAKENQLPQSFSSYRKEELGTTNSLAYWAAKECGLEHVYEDPRVVKTLASMLDQGYDAIIKDGKVFVQKTCEVCRTTFQIDHRYREGAFCSSVCTAKHLNTNKNIAAKRNVGIRKAAIERSEKNRQSQLLVYTDLKSKLNRQPKMKEWETECKAQGIPYRVGKTLKYGFKTYKEVCKAGDEFNHRVISIEYVGKEDVYNGTVDDTHSFLFGGFYELQKNGKKKLLFFNNQQCGEIILSGEDSCRLLLLNTLSFVDHPFTSKAKFNFKKFKHYTIFAQRLMDDLIDLEIEAIDKIINKVKSDPEPDEVKAIEIELWQKIRSSAVRGRRTGLGVNAIGDTMAALGIKYGSSESIKMTEEIYKSLALNAYRSSCQLAKERGTFEVYDFKLEKGHPFIEQLFEAEPQLRSLHKKYGRRNIALTTTAPSGSVSILTQTSSGIEPVFMTDYTRRKKINPSDKEARVDYTDDLGDRWQEFTVYHYGLKRWMDVTGETDISKSPYAGATANEIDWVAGVDLQAAAQKWVCHAISKTTNLPEDITVEEVNKVYWHGWKAGLKGITVYREGSRSGVLVSSKGDVRDEEGRPASISQVQSPKRPESLSCEIHHATVKGTPWTVLLGMMEEDPYEIFMGYSETLSLPKKCQLGKIVKLKKGRYDLHVDIGSDEPLVIKDIVKTFNNPESSWATRMVSLSLRHGVPLEFMVEQLGKDGGMLDVNKVLSRILKKFIRDGAKVKTSLKCSNCESDSLIYMEGCATCSNCGWSKCN